MDMDQSAVFLAGSILTTLGFVIIAVGVIVINNLVGKYWKPVTIFSKDSFSLFGNHGVTPISTLTDDEYNELVNHLEEYRKSKTETKKK